MNNTIFLDFDGVLNAFYYPKQLADRGQAWRDRFGVLFAPECIAQLGRIIEATEYLLDFIQCKPRSRGYTHCHTPARSDFMFGKMCPDFST